MAEELTGPVGKYYRLPLTELDDQLRDGALDQYTVMDWLSLLIRHAAVSQ